MYGPEEFIDMEIEILRTLGWRLNGPTPRDFIQYYIELFPPSTDETTMKFFVEEVTKNAEVAMLDYAMALKVPSRIALISAASLSLRSVSADVRSQLDTTGWMHCIGSVMKAASTHLVD
jgi:hypothetical protein